MKITKELIKNIKRDALAGTVTGFMAVPLTVGICLMSDYPVMTGLYTVIFAGFISFITYLFKPGNYTGMPGVAAGLAPALALGVSAFGYENMPFVILLTATFQAIIWKFRWEKYILRIVPHYLVEGLLAGVGLKIALKFIPFLYDIEHETDVWLNLEREAVIFLSLFSFLSFVLLFKYYQKKMPALPYLLIMFTSVGLSFIMPLPKVTIDSIPFNLQLPVPDFSGYDTGTSLIMLAKMIGFAIMLGTIDIIEQVMSHVAIEKMDPYQRKGNTNNGLMAIWIANMGATFFGGMTNLDGLAKSTTNTVAGAVTKLSNVFTSFFLIAIVVFPSTLTYMPEYALGIIMIYSGWKMIANIANVRSEGRYALIMAGACGLLVFELGIFEGLLLLLIIHAMVQFVFMKRVGRSNADIFNQLKDVFSSETNQTIEKEDSMTEPALPILNKWIKAVNTHDMDALMKLYADDAIMIPAFSSRVRKNKKEIGDLYKDLFVKDDLHVEPKNSHTQKINGLKVDSGHYRIIWQSKGFEESNILRFSFVIKDQRIVTHHSSIEPVGETTISHPTTFGHEYVD